MNRLLLLLSNTLLVLLETENQHTSQNNTQEDYG